MKTLIKLLTVAAITTTLVACSGTPTADISMQAANYLNPDENGASSPIMVSVYELKSPAKFEQGTYEQIANNSSQYLGQDLIDKQTLEIHPGTSKSLNSIISPGTTYIGIIAAYRDLDQSKWRSLVKLQDSDSSISLNINLEAHNLITTVN